MLVDAIVLAGGRSSRLSGTPKALLLHRGTTLLDLAVQAAAHIGARRIAVVGTTGPTTGPTTPTDRVLLTREEPPFGGPAAGVGAGAAALTAASTDASQARSDATLVLACDLPEVAQAIGALFAKVPWGAGTDGIVLVDADNRMQPLTALYSSSSLASALDARRRHAPLDGLSMNSLIAGLRLKSVHAPPGSTDDIDTWADAARHGIQDPAQTAVNQPTTSQPETT